MRKKLLYINVFILALMMIMGNVRTFAQPSSDNIVVEVPRWVKNNVKYECNIDPNSPYINDIDRSKGKLPLFEVDATGKKITYRKDNFNKCLSSARKDAVKLFIKDLQMSGLDEQVQQSVIDTISQGDRNISRLLIPAIMDNVSADLYSAGKAVNPFLGFLNVVLGVLVYVIMFLIILSSTLDLAYIGIPIFRDSADGRANDKGKIPFISSDAVSVVKESEGGSGSSGGYKNPYITYFKRRFITYIVLAFCIMYLIMGEISSLISWLLSLGEGLFN